MNDLQNFLEVAHCKTMSEAARRLGITQPALSESIKRLEEDLQEVLLYRSRVGVTLTPNGQAVLSHSKTAMDSLHEIENLHAQRDQYGTRVITIGCHSTVASYCIPKSLEFLQSRAPDYRIHLKHELSRNIQTEVQQGRIDVGIIVNAIPSPDIVIKIVGQDQVAVWASKNADQDRVFCNGDLIQTQSILRKWKNQPKLRTETSSLELIVRLTERGLGFGIIPARAVELLGAQIKKVPNTPTFDDHISLVHRPEFGRSNIEKDLLAALISGIRSNT